MSFLAPLFLLGALAVALPVIFHLVRRTTRERTLFSSLLFLMPSPPRLTRRSRLEHLLLLALRCLVLCLLALGFARPFLKNAVNRDPPANSARQIVVLVDASASMRRANWWPLAREKADAILRGTTPADQVALYTFARQVNPLMTFEQWNSTPAGDRPALARRRLLNASPTWLSTHLGNALISAAEVLAENEGNQAFGVRQIVLITDLQEGSRLEGLQGYEWPKGVELVIEPVKGRNGSNAGIQWVADLDDSGRKTDPGVRIRVSNAADSKREQFKVGWAQSDGQGFTGTPVDVYVPPGQSRMAVLPAAVAQTNVDQVTLRGDDDDFDNTVSVIPPETARYRVTYLGDDAAADTRQPLYFLQRAFQETRRQTVEVSAHPANAVLPPGEAQASALFVVTDTLAEESARALHAQVAAGKTLLFAPKNAMAAPTLARIMDLENIPLEEARPANYAMLTEIDFRHPLFAPFADPRFSDFTKIHFWKYRRLDAARIPGARVAARFDSGDAAIVEAPAGKGRVFILTSSWHPEDSQLALSSKFVPLLYSLLEQTGGAAPPPAQYLAGDVVSLASLSESQNGAVTVRLPDGSPVNLAAGETNFSQALIPGVYRVESSQAVRRFVVNLDPAESRTAPMAADELERLGAPMPHRAPPAAHEAKRKVQLQNAELEGRQKLWRWFILATLAVLLAETWLAGWTARRLAAPGEAVV